MLASLDKRVRETVGKNLISGFRSCGLFPVNRNEALRKLPDSNIPLTAQECNASLNDTLIDLLQVNRGCSEQEKLARGKKIPKVVPGLKLVVAGQPLELDEKEEEEEEEEGEIDFQNHNAPCSSNESEGSLPYAQQCYACRDAEDDQKGSDSGEWTKCDLCGAWFHHSCLLRLVGDDHNCIFCSSEDEDDLNSSELESEDSGKTFKQMTLVI